MPDSTATTCHVTGVSFSKTRPQGQQTERFYTVTGSQKNGPGQTQGSHVLKQKETPRSGFIPTSPFIVAQAGSELRQLPPPFQVDPGCGSARPWVRSHGGEQPRPCGRRLASSSCGEPIFRDPGSEVSLLDPRQTKTNNIPLCGGGGTRSNLQEPGCIASCRSRPRQRSPHNIQEPPARRDSSGRGLERVQISQKINRETIVGGGDWSAQDVTRQATPPRTSPTPRESC